METKERRRYVTWLIYAIVLTTIVTTITLSRYTSNVSSTSSGEVATIVTVQKEIELISSNQVLKPGQEVKYKFGITNKENDEISDVTQNYDIYFKTTGNLPLTYELQKDDGGSSYIYAVPTTITDGFYDNEFCKINSDSGTLPHTNEEIHYYNLIVKWPEKAGYDDDKYATEIDAITIRFEATQVD